MDFHSTGVEEECSRLLYFDRIPQGKLSFLGVISLQFKEKYKIVF